jgi:hypothetical protein
MALMVAHWKEVPDPGAIVRNLHELVTLGPWDLEIAAAMYAHGYDEAKWAEGQGVLAELLTNDVAADASLSAAVRWYEEAATIAQRALASRPRLLQKLGVVIVSSELV